MLHIERLKVDIDAMGRFAAERRQQRDEAIETAQAWLAEAPPADVLRDGIEAVFSTGEPWTGALPATDDPLDTKIAESGEPQRGTVLVAVDGSQIFPDSHGAVLYYLLQVGGLIFRYDGSTPTPQSREWLFFEDAELYNAQGYVISAERVGMQRLVREMAFAVDLAEGERRVRPDAPLLAVTDGPLLWPYIARQPEEHAALQAYLDAMTRARRARAALVGYVARPGGRALLDLLWASQCLQRDISGALPSNPLHILTDVAWMAHVLAPGERTSWFQRPIPTNRRHASEGHAIWFCYLNLGTPRQPIIVRVEVPAWVARDEAPVATAHRVLRHQAAALAGYPYALARAHEEALVTHQDRAALEDEIQRQLFARGQIVHPSEKARQKAYLGQRR